MISEHYTKNERPDVIFKTALALEMCLTMGYNSKNLTFKMLDLGVKPDDLGLSMALAMKKTDDKYLSNLDQEIKKIVLEKFADMIKELESVLN